MKRARDRGDDRAIAPVIGTVLVVALVVVLAAGAGGLLLRTGGDLHEPPSAMVSVAETTFTDGAECGGVEVALDVTLTQFERADTIYVIADGGAKQPIWTDPGSTTVGETMRIANEQVGNGGTDVDIGGGGDTAICPGDEVTFRFYAEYDGEVLTLHRHTVQ